MSAEQKSYKLSPRAKRDLSEIWLYTREMWSIAQADSYYRDLTNSMQALAGGIKRGKPIDSVHPGYLSSATGSHRIIYRYRGPEVFIIRILHQRMNFRQHL
ncbi:toxin ParE1/3/4 [Neorhizobium huautlense]|uniref:Toxin n=1 Tax=Neorhizobium huautlense TaxID=67774 RepID=A0ABT9PTD8_9HYPH|nr:type II toxin-antitoxin system RelE/ParE family toxin [Neorhizobium huautlense]MDP9837440.1 toxin ParE1/3/4 [Neorhizobium huautlense]